MLYFIFYYQFWEFLFANLAKVLFWVIHLTTTLIFHFFKFKVNPLFQTFDVNIFSWTLAIACIDQRVVLKVFVIIADPTLYFLILLIIISFQFWLFYLLIQIHYFVALIFKSFIIVLNIKNFELSLSEFYSLIFF